MKSRLMRAIKWALLGLAGVFVLVLLALALVRIPVNLDGQRSLFETVASEAIKRPVRIDGDIGVTTSLWPVFQMTDVHIRNPDGFPAGNVASMDSVKLQVSILPLLLRKVHVQDFAVQGLHLALLVDENGAVNWASTQVATHEDTEEPTAPETSQPTGVTLASDTLAVEQIELDDISVSYHKPGMAEPFEFVIEHATGSAQVGEPLNMHFQGSVRKEPFETTLKAASLEELLVQNRSWMEIKIRIAGASLVFAGGIDLVPSRRRTVLAASVDGEQLEQFNRLLSVDLPPVPRYAAKASLSLEKDKLALTDLNLTVNSSELNGEMEVSRRGAKPRIDVSLESPLVRLDDFVFEGWSADEDAAPDVEAAAQESDDEVDAEDATSEDSTADDGEKRDLARLLSPDFLERFDARLHVTAQKVVSGEDELGNGELQVQLAEGRISIDPLMLTVPGGSILMSMSLKPGHDASNATLRIKAENFDIGVLARRANPETDMGGRINIDVDLNSSADQWGDILADGNGYVDFSMHPKNLRAGILDLWAVNLISAIAERTDKEQSQIECMISRWSLDDGVLKPDVVVLDTSRMRICLAGSVEFKQRQIDLKARPTAKRPEFFSLATPVEIKGSFSDFELGIQRGGVIGTGVKFITSPIHVPLRRVFKEDLPADGSDVCGMPLGPERPTERAPGCPRL